MNDTTNIYDLSRGYRNFQHIWANALSHDSRKLLLACVHGGKSIVVTGGHSENRQHLLSFLMEMITREHRVTRLISSPSSEQIHEDVTLFDRNMPDLVQTIREIAPEFLLIDNLLLDDQALLSQASLAEQPSLILGIDAENAVGAVSRLGEMMGQTWTVQQITLVIECRQREGGFRIERISELNGLEGDKWQLNDVFERWPIPGKATVTLRQTGLVPIVTGSLAEQGILIPRDLFTITRDSRICKQIHELYGYLRNMMMQDETVRLITALDAARYEFNNDLIEVIDYVLVGVSLGLALEDIIREVARKEDVAAFTVFADVVSHAYKYWQPLPAALPTSMPC